jgi:hypothetical protein
MKNGFIVVNTDGKCLDRNLQWRSKQALTEAFVHPKETVVAGGPWASVAGIVYPAEYDPSIDFARTTGQPVQFVKFVVDAIKEEAEAAPAAS